MDNKNTYSMKVEWVFFIGGAYFSKNDLTILDSYVIVRYERWKKSFFYAQKWIC